MSARAARRLLVCILVFVLLLVAGFGVFLWWFAGVSRPAVAAAVLPAAADYEHAQPEQPVLAIAAKPEFITLARPHPLHQNRGDAYSPWETPMLAPGVYLQLERLGDWALLETNYGNRWVNLHFMPPTVEIARMMEYINGRVNGNVSIFYQNLDYRLIFGFDDNREFFSASLNKASHALFIYHLAEIGTITLDSIHTFTAANRRTGTGLIWRNYPLGARFTTEQLLMYSVRESDNTAFRILVDYFAQHCYETFIRSIGANPDMVGNIHGRRFSANEAAFIMEHIANYVQGGGRFAPQFREDLRLGYPIIFADYESLHKYGWWAPYFHDMAIVYACSPYILVIMSNLAINAQLGAHDVFHEISLFIQEFNNRYFRRN